MAIDSRSRSRRDRHSRGLRGPLLPHNAPFHETPDQFFARQMDLALSEFESRVGSQMSLITFAIESVPSERDFVLSDGIIPLGRIERGNPHLVVLYQRPIEMRGVEKIRTIRVMRDVLAELIARIVGMIPEDVDPEYLGPKNSD